MLQSTRAASSSSSSSSVACHARLTHFGYATPRQRAIIASFVPLNSRRSRHVPLNCTNSMDNTHETSHIQQRVASRRLLDIIAFLWGLPHLISEYVKKEEKFVDKVEEEIEEMANIVKVGAEVIEEVAKGVETIAKVVEVDAEKVDTLMDEVKERSKVAHDELEGAMKKLDEAAQELDKAEKHIETKSKANEHATNGQDEPTISPHAISELKVLRIHNEGKLSITLASQKVLESLFLFIFDSMKHFSRAYKWSSLRMSLGFVFSLWFFFRIFLLKDLSVIL